MPIFKNKTQGQYVNVYKDILKNHSLSLRDRGMVVTLLSLPDNWEFTISGLSKIIPDGKSSIGICVFMGANRSQAASFRGCDTRFDRCARP